MTERSESHHEVVGKWKKESELWRGDTRSTVGARPLTVCAKTLYGHEDVSGHDFRGCGKTRRAKRICESAKLVWHSAASRNAIDASLATHGGSPGLQAGESFLRIGLQPWPADLLKIVAKRKEFRT